jgi:hypothetical protein
MDWYFSSALALDLGGVRFLTGVFADFFLAAMILPVLET